MLCLHRAELLELISSIQFSSVQLSFIRWIWKWYANGRTTINISSKFDWKVIATEHARNIQQICAFFEATFNDNNEWMSIWNHSPIYVISNRFHWQTNRSIYWSNTKTVSCQTDGDENGDGGDDDGMSFTNSKRTNGLIKMRICRKWHALFDQLVHTSLSHTRTHTQINLLARQWNNAVFLFIRLVFYVTYSHSLAMIKLRVPSQLSPFLHKSQLSRVRTHADTWISNRLDSHRLRNNKWNA